MAARADGPQASANGSRQEIQRACDPLRKKHLQRFHRKRKNRADDRAKRDTPEWRCAYWKPRNEETERTIRDDVEPEVVAQPSIRPAREQEERCPGRGLDPVAERLQRGVDDRQRVQRRERMRQACLVMHQSRANGFSITMTFPPP